MKKATAFNALSITETHSNINQYRIEYFSNGNWKTVVNGDITKNVKVHRFSPVTGSKIRIHILKARQQVSIAEVGIYNEKI
ncbi:discoidin domain-containing protein [Niabella sp. W65]|nr:discoidin domain-containing protein [Niabella sp. W65]MCH7366300.1 discoidin domain-containing protein [Niabella sp. W65]ULT42023.1 discoidin domain-containing protein [Niabella sp. I65]